MHLSKSGTLTNLRCSNEYEREELYEVCSLMYTAVARIEARYDVDNPEPYGGMQAEVDALSNVLNLLDGHREAGVYDILFQPEAVQALAQVMSCAGELMHAAPGGLSLRCNLLGHRLEVALGTMGVYGSNTISTVV